MTEMITETNATTDTVDRYIAIWNGTDTGLRRDLITQTWTPECSYLDPMLSGDGHSGIETMTLAFQHAYPGHTFHRVGTIDRHHDRIRFGWELRTPGGDTFVRGTDFGVIDENNLLQSITGFFEPS